MTADYRVFRIRPAVLSDAAKLAPNLRLADCQEVAAGLGIPPQEALELGVKNSSSAYAAELPDGTIIALFGVTPTPEHSVGAVWMLGSDRLTAHRLTVLRHSKEWLKLLFERYQLLGNFVDARNTLHIAWLRWLGFRFFRSCPIGIHGEEFLEFARLKE